MEMAALVGVQRILENHQNKVSNLTYNASSATLWQNAVSGALGEMVLAKAANRYWSKGERGDPDVDDMEVRTTVYPNGSMLLHPDDDDHKVSILVTGSIGNFKIVGYIRNKEGKEKGTWEERKEGRPCFYVKQENLIPFTNMEDLEKFKHQCAVRQLLVYYFTDAKSYNTFIEKRGRDNPIFWDFVDQGKKGNKGDTNEWFE